MFDDYQSDHASRMRCSCSSQNQENSDGHWQRLPNPVSRMHLSPVLLTNGYISGPRSAPPTLCNTSSSLCILIAQHQRHPNLSVSHRFGLTTRVLLQLERL